MQPKKTNVAALVILAAVGGAFGWWFRAAANETIALYAEQAEILGATTSVVSAVEVNKTRVAIPSWTLFKDGELWSLVSKQHQLREAYAPSLVAVPVAHTAGDLQVARTIEQPLKALFIAAENDGVRLMVSSAYRSPEAQQKIYDAYRTMYGDEYVKKYVALPRNSEHQTGLAVDIATYGRDCEQDANACSLDVDSIAWLNSNASTYGFLQRYPSGKQSITGIAGEAWHYRHVGKVLATTLETNSMTLDEFVQQAAPAYAR